MVTQRDRSTQTAPSLHILMSTGEVSGDLQGSLLIQALYRQAKSLGCSLQISAVGGHRMAKAGAHLIGDTTAIGSVGLLEAIPFLFPTLKMQRQIRQYLQQKPADLVIFIDYMNPNLHLGQFLRKTYPTLATAYYIVPQQWVWTFSEKETQALVEISDKMVAIFPQEAEYYRKFGADIRYFGHPLVDKLASPPSRLEAREALGLDSKEPIITLLPASRWQEVKYVLPILLAVAQEIQKTLPEIQFLVPISMDKLRPKIADAIAESGIRAQLIEGQGQAAIAAADLVLNKSGTVNLEVALMKVPQIVVYRLNPLTARIAYYLLNCRVDHISPVNLFVNKTIVPEFIQWEATVDAITAASLNLLEDTDARAKMLASYDELRDCMGQPGVCDQVAANLLSFALQPVGVS
ncbi:MAG: lipid-A-disaccharide synthase [Leptolyngbya sp. SIO1D8]|nr:lipid-A-disaccharide synthase [Leptolyngbya sp. SIO1D8]